MIKIKKHHWDVNNLNGLAMSQKLPVNNFEWIEDTSQFNEDFIKSCNAKSYKGYFLEVWCLMSWKITWTSQWFTIFTWEDEDWKSWKDCS